MPSNDYYHLTPERTALLAKQIATTVGENYATYGLTKPECDLLATTATATQAECADVLAKKSAYLGALSSRDANAASCVQAIAKAAAAIYRKPGVTTAMIRDLGLEPRATTRTKVVPRTPTDVMAKVDRFAVVSISFKRAGNAPGVIFRLENRLPGGAWTLTAEGTATRFTVPGLSPEPRVFRVIAIKSGLEAAPSNEAGIYGASVAPPVPAALRLEEGGAQAA